MIIQQATDNKYVLFTPETPGERKKLDDFPGLLREGLVFYAPAKPHIVYNLYTRLSSRIKRIQVSKNTEHLISGEINIKELPIDFKFYTKPLRHQEIALRFGYTFGNFLNLSEPGLGKTKETLDFIAMMKFKKSLIVCPKPLRDVWIDENKKHRPDLTSCIIKSSDWEKEKKRVDAVDIVVINYDLEVSLEKHLLKVGFDFIAVDEGLIKNPSTERTKSITRLGRSIPNRCVMSGTLVNNSPLDVFAPIRFVEPALVGHAFGKFREEYSVSASKNKFITIGYKHVPEVKELLSSTGFVMTKSEWLKNLPAKIFNRIYVQMGDEQREDYRKLASNYLVSVKGVEIEVDNPLSLMMKLNQISNGYVYYKEDERESLEDLFGGSVPGDIKIKAEKVKDKTKRQTIFFDEQPKSKALLSLIDSEKFNNRDTVSSGGTRAIIWFNMTAELQIILKALAENDESYLVIKGGDKEISKKIAEFNSDPSVRFLVCQAKTLNYGVTILGETEKEWNVEALPEFDPMVSDEIFYSLNFSLEVFLQQQDRIHRIGQTRECRYWMILTNSVIEKRIADRLEEKLICNREILVDIAGSLDMDKLFVDSSPTVC